MSALCTTFLFNHPLGPAGMFAREEATGDKEAGRHVRRRKRIVRLTSPTRLRLSEVGGLMIYAPVDQYVASSRCLCRPHPQRRANLLPVI
jgi:hypothetical protein